MCNIHVNAFVLTVLHILYCLFKLFFELKKFVWFASALPKNVKKGMRDLKDVKIKTLFVFITVTPSLTPKST